MSAGYENEGPERKRAREIAFEVVRLAGTTEAAGFPSFDAHCARGRLETLCTPENVIMIAQALVHGLPEDFEKALAKK